jgi:hypothetical protein
MRKMAIESCRSLSLENHDTQVKLFDMKELHFMKTDPDSQLISRSNAYLTSAVNLHLANSDSTYSCTTFEEANAIETKTRKVKNQLVVMDIAELQKLDETVLKILNSSEAIMTNQPDDLNIEALYKKIYNIYIGD